MTANLGTLAAGATVDIDHRGRYCDQLVTSARSPIQRRLRVEQTNPVPSALDASVTTQVVADADVAVALTASPGSVLAGGELTDTFTISNLGPQTATGVTATSAVGGGRVVCFGRFLARRR